MVELSALDKRARLVALRNDMRVALRSLTLDARAVRALIGRTNEFPELKAKLVEQRHEVTALSNPKSKKSSSKIRISGAPRITLSGDGRFQPTEAQKARSALFMLCLQIVIALIFLVILGFAFWYAPI